MSEEDEIEVDVDPDIEEQEDSDLEDNEDEPDVDLDDTSQPNMDSQPVTIIRDPSKFITINILTKFEKAAVVSHRAAQLSSNPYTPLLMKGYTNEQLSVMSATDIALAEIDHKVCPLTVQRIISIDPKKIEEIDVNMLSC